MRTALLLSLGLAVVSIARAGEPSTRFGIALYDPPAGWAASDKDGRRTYAAPDAGFTLALSPSRQLDGTVDQVVDGLAEEAKKLPAFREEAARSGGKHIPTAGQWKSLTYSYADPSRPGQYLYEWATVVGAGGRYVTVTSTAATSEAFQKHAGKAAALVNGLKLTTVVRLEKGTPPLTRFMVDETADFLEWLLQTPMTEGQRKTVEAELRTSWKEGRADEIQDIQELLEGREKLGAMKIEEREVVRQAALDQAIQEWRADTKSAAAKLMLSIHEATRKPIAAGDPPLTRQDVDAFVEFIYFAASRTAGVDVSPKDEVKAKMAEEIAGTYAKLPEDQRKVFPKMPLAWASLRMLWPDMGEAEKQEMIAGWRKSEELVALGKTLAQEAQSRFLEASARLQAQQMQFQMMSNIMRMQHETSMTIISNMGGNWRYEYRW